jgi:hypothetical protein
MIGFIRKLWRHHKVKAAKRRMYLDQEHSSGHGIDGAQHIITEQSVERRIR